VPNSQLKQSHIDSSCPVLCVLCCLLCCLPLPAAAAAGLSAGLVPAAYVEDDAGSVGKAEPGREGLPVLSHDARNNCADVPHMCHVCQTQPVFPHRAAT
jgi:hypothetical protein